MIRVIIADDHTLFREGLCALIKSVDDITIVGEASDGKEAIALIEEHTPDIAILDFSMPEYDGIEVFHHVHQQQLPTKVMLLTVNNDPILATQALKMGICGYVLKGNAFDDLRYAIKTVNQGGKFMTPSLTGEIFSAHAGDSSKAKLSKREAEVLKLIGQGYSNQQIADKLAISIKTVETYNTRIMIKLGLDSKDRLLKYAIIQAKESK